MIIISEKFELVFSATLLWLGTAGLFVPFFSKWAGEMKWWEATCFLFMAVLLGLMAIIMTVMAIDA